MTTTDTLGKITATFNVADPTPDDVLTGYEGQRVTVLRESLDAQRVRFSDGIEADAFNDELTEWRLEA